MTEFSFDRATLSGLSEADKKSAAIAADTAEALAGYYQDVAKAIVDGTGEIRPPSLTAEQAKLAREAQVVMTGGSGTVAAVAATKIFLAAQMDFYRNNPKYVAAFAGNPPEVLAAVEEATGALPQTWGPVDQYFETALQAARNVAATYQQQPPRGPAPGGP